MIRTRKNIEFVESLLSVFVQWEHDGKDYIEYLRTSKGGDEFDIRDWFVKPLFEKLGYEKGDFNHEHSLFSGKPDFFIKPTMFPPLITVETKSATVVQKDFTEARTNQLIPAMKELRTPTGVLTNGIRFEVYHEVGKTYQRVIDIDFGGLVIAYKKKGIAGISNDAFDKLIKLLWLKKSHQTIKDESFYPLPDADISESTQFDLLLDDLAGIIEMVKIDVEERLNIYLDEFKDYEERVQHLQGSESTRLYKEKKESIHARRLFEKWAQINNIALNKIEIGKDKFITETMYILVNRILLIRIAEDKEIISRKISNGAIKEYKEYVKENRINYSRLLDEGYRTIEVVYEHLFKRDIFDWYSPDSELLMKVLFMFNRYNFSKVNRDILGNLYQKYIDKEERKRLGQFYTPHDIIDNILDSVGFDSENEIENMTLLDPSCGSGGFLVPVVNRLVSRLRKKNYDAFTILSKVKDNIYGFDINPFAAHLTETNLLFQVIDLIGEAKRKNSNFKMERFNICVSDALKLPAVKSSGKTADLFRHEEEDSVAAEDLEIVKDIKLKRGRFQKGVNFVVGNPPYVTNYAKHSKKIPQIYIDEIKITYDFSRNRASNRYNLIMFFVERGISLLSDGGRFGMIVDESSFATTLYSEIRKFILDHCKIISVLNNLEAFEDVNTKQMILILEKESDERNRKSHKVMWNTWNDDKEIIKVSISQSLWYSTRNFAFEPPNSHESILSKIEKGKNLALLYDPISGMNVTNRLASGLKPFLSNEKLDSTYHKAIFSGNIRRYKIEWPIPEQTSSSSRKMLYICYDKQLAFKINEYLESKREKARVSIGESDLRYRKPKLFIRQSLPGDERITSALSSNMDEYCDNSVYVINQKRDEYPLEYLLAILNSPLMTFWAKQRQVLSKGATGSALRLPMGSKGKGLRDFPIFDPKITEQQGIISLVNKIQEMMKKMERFIHLENDPSAIAENEALVAEEVKLADSNLIDYIELPESLGKPTIKRIKRRVYLSRNNYIDLTDEKVAVYVELSLRRLENILRGMTKAEILRSVSVPKTLGGVEKVLARNEVLKTKKRKLEEAINALEKSINQKVYELYGLTKEEVSIVEAK